MNAYRPVIALAVLLFVAGCSSEPPAGTDAGPTQQDGGVNVDAGGNAEVDAGHEEDAGLTDAGADGGEPCDGGAFSTGEVTYYDAMGASGACSVPLTFANHAAATSSVYANAGACGACAEIVGPEGSTLVIVSDLCPGCGTTYTLDLSPSSFDAIANPQSGKVTASWRFVPCPVNGNLQYRVDPGSNDYWLSFVVWNHSQRLASVEVLESGQTTYVALTRTAYNAWVFNPGHAIAYPLDLKLTDASGNVVVDTLMKPAAGEIVDGAVQFPVACFP